MPLFLLSYSILCSFFVIFSILFQLSSSLFSSFCFSLVSISFSLVPNYFFSGSDLCSLFVYYSFYSFLFYFSLYFLDEFSFRVLSVSGSAQLKGNFSFAQFCLFVFSCFFMLSLFFYAIITFFWCLRICPCGLRPLLRHQPRRLSTLPVRRLHRLHCCR